MIRQGDIVKIEGITGKYLVVSTNNFIKLTNHFHVCPIVARAAAGPLHIVIEGNGGENGTAFCEQIKLIDPSARAASKIDDLPYSQIMNISDAIQCIFEYD